MFDLQYFTLTNILNGKPLQHLQAAAQHCTPIQTERDYYIIAILHTILK